MAAAKKPAAKDEADEPTTQDVEDPDRAVDPPEATAEGVTDVERSSALEWVLLNQSVILTLPSGASFAFSAGQSRRLRPEDADFVVAQGYGVRADNLSGE